VVDYKSLDWASLMNIKELAEYLQVDVTTLYTWSQKGKIPAMKLGVVWRYRKEDIDEWLEQQKIQPGDDERK